MNLKGVTAVVAAGSTNWAAVLGDPLRLNDSSPAGTYSGDTVAAAAPMKLRREMAGAATCVLFTKSFS